MSWLYFPGLECCQKDCELGSPTWASRLAPSATLSGKVTLPASWLRACKKDHWTKRLSGPTFAPSTLNDGLDRWISSLEGFLAPTSLWLGKGLDSTALEAAFSSTSLTSPTIAVRSTSFWRTSAASLLPPPPLWTKPKGLLTSARPPESWENWPTEGGMRNGSLYPRPKWVPATGGQGGSALLGDNWTTPDVCSGARDMSKIDPELQKRADTKRTTGLPTEAAMWLTPNVPNGGRSVSAELVASKGTTEDGQKRTVGLESQTRYWEALHLVAYSPLAQATHDGQESSPQNPGLPQPSTKRLNPYFAERLMGWPTGWTSATEPSASSASETESFRLKQQSLLASLLPELKDFLNDDNK